MNATSTSPLIGAHKRVFRLCWFHHHSGYDKGYITTEELIEAEDAWIAGRRPKPQCRLFTI
jgi:hypothetical protein